MLVDPYRLCYIHVVMSYPNSSVKQRFNHASSTYDAHSHIQQQICSHLLDYLDLNASPYGICELGCGTGLSSLLLHQHFKESPITAIDFSPDMISYAIQHHSHPLIHYHCDDILTLTLPHSVDLVFSNATLHWCSPQKKALHSIKSLLNPSGTLCFSAFGPKTFQELSYCLSTLSPHPISFPCHHFPSANDWKNLLRQTFRHIHIKQALIKIPFDHLLSLLRHIHYSGTRGSTPNQLFWTPGFLKKCHSLYLNTFHSISVSYHVFYCIARF